MGKYLTVTINGTMIHAVKLHSKLMLDWGNGAQERERERGEVLWA